MARADADRKRREDLHDFPDYGSPRPGGAVWGAVVARRVPDARRGVLSRLGEALDATGEFTVRVLEWRTRPPELHVSRNGMARLTEDVGAELDGDGAWWLTWSWGERICRADDVPAAVASIGRVLGVRE